MTEFPFWALVTKLNGERGSFDSMPLEAETPEETDEDIDRTMREKPERR